ncbi:hypothetical protein BDV33DRAFT_197126 [Aspergillus novoparasiticus]|uniref:DUF2786 domain-containing protein n=1 Tax=Aspergillus novoparasiticus TaxID=986946 RepID=A0A5N6E6W6_9EURO|nr:hypothetical protein BDV33DRAFT_197126 [Aspergillus novoparasiticus]
MRAKKQRQPLQKATVIKTAQVKPKDSLGSLDRGVLIKIQKCLSRARHKSTTESETKAALFVAQKLMAQYNVSQADLVEIINVKSRTRRVMKEAFVHKLAKAMSAVAFEMAHNKILDWAFSYKGGSPTFSYRVGVADGLVSMANHITAAKEREVDMERERKPQRLYKGPSLALGIDGQSEDEIPSFLDIDSMSDESYGSLESIDSLNLHTRGALADFNEMMRTTPSPSVKQNPSDKNSSFVKSEDMSNSPWISETLQVADEYLKKHNIKFCLSRRVKR